MQDSTSADHRRLVKTNTPGIYRRGASHVVVYRDRDGRQKKQTLATATAARAFKATVTADKSRGDFVAPTRTTLAEYYADWLPRYGGRTTRGIRTQTKAGYADVMERHVLPVLGDRRLSDIGPRDIAKLAHGLRDKNLSRNTVRLALAPLKALLATAFEEEVIRRNPAANVRIARPGTADAMTKPKALTEEELRALLTEMPDQWRHFFTFLAQTGLRIGEALALQWSDVDFGTQHIHVRRRWYRGTYAAPKSRFGQRRIPLTPTTTRELWKRGATCAPGALVFPSGAGTPINAANLYSRIYKPAARRAGVPWATFHTLRHTCATMLFKSGKNVKQVQAWLGHHAASFTMDTYVHLLPDDVGSAPVSFATFGIGVSSEADLLERSDVIG
jgi:integrase